MARPSCLADTSIHQPADDDGQLLNATGTGLTPAGAGLLYAAARCPPFPFDGTRRGFPSDMKALIRSAVSSVTLQPERSRRTRCRWFMTASPNAVALMSFSTMNRSMSASNLSVDLVMSLP